MKTYMPLNGLRWSRNSGSANCDMPQSAVFGRPGGGFLQTSIIGHTPMYRKIKYLIGINVHCLVRYGTLFERVFAKI